MGDTPRTDAILALLPGGQSCDPQAVADDLRPEIASLERELEQERQLADRMAATLRFIDEECDWEAGGDHWHGSFGDDRIGPACDEALASWKAARNEAVDPP